MKEDGETEMLGKGVQRKKREYKEGKAESEEREGNSGREEKRKKHDSQLMPSETHRVVIERESREKRRLETEVKGNGKRHPVAMFTLHTEAAQNPVFLPTERG